MAQTLAERQKSKAATKIAEVVREGEKITLPTNMSYSEAIAHLQRVIKYDEETVEPSQSFDAFPWDGAYALTLALTELFGWYSLEKSPGFFGPTPPQMISVETGPDSSVKVPWGRFTIPQIPYDEGYLTTSTTMKHNRMVFELGGKMRRKYEPIFARICDEIKAQLAKRSLYKGKAFKMRFKDDNGALLAVPEPRFLRLSLDAVNNLVLSRDVEKHVVTSLFTPIEKYHLLPLIPLPFKRGVLLGGKFGVGKTMLSLATAIKAVANGITFVLCSRADEVALAVDFISQYPPGVVFCEDIDRTTSGARSVSMDEILNIVDGIESKGLEIMVVATTNEKEKINPAMLRPGRMDAVIEIKPPDAEAVGRLIKVYAKGQVDPKADLTQVGKVLAGEVPAVIQECVHRAKLYALSQATHPTDIKLTATALLDAAEGMREQLDLLNGSRTAEVHPSVLAGHLIGKHLAEAIRSAGFGIRHLEPQFAKVMDAEVKELVSTSPIDGEED